MSNQPPAPAPHGPASLSGLLRGFRTRALLTQEQLAEESGLSVGTIQALENGRILRPRSASIRLLADALRLTSPQRALLTAAAAGEPTTLVPDQVPPPTPCQLPMDLADFTGRTAQLTALQDLLCHGDQDPGQPTTAVISAIQGAGGIGKSALAIHAAHRLAERFPHGQLYIDLHGATTGLTPLAPLKVLGRFLRALGVDGDRVPTQVEEAAALLRSQVAGRRMLMVLDNARDAAQVRPLLPATPGCGVLVTSRRALPSLDGAHHLHLDVLAEREAIDLLARLAGAERVAAGPEAAAEVARWCGYLPLALRIAGARLATRPTWPLRLLAERLADARRRLDELELSDIGVRASFAVSQQELAGSADPLDRAAASAFQLLGLLDGPDVGVPAAARLLDRTEDETERVLERLVDTNLLESPTPGRYRLHDLLRLYAREQAAKGNTEAARAAALIRAFGFYAATAWGTLALLRPGDFRLTHADDRWRKDGLELADQTAALAWLETERANLLAAVGQAATTPGVPSAVAVQVAQGMVGLFLVRNYWQDWVEATQIALGVARSIGDRVAQALACNDLGVAYWRQGRNEQALACLRESLALFGELGDRRGQAKSLTNLGLVHERQGQYEQALTCQQESLTLSRELGDRHGQGVSLTNLGLLHERQGRYGQALTCQQESLTLSRELGDHHGQAVALGNIGEIHGRQGQYEKALACLREGLAICRKLGDRWTEAFLLHDLGVVYQRQGRNDRALTCQQESLDIRRELGDRHGQGESLRALGMALRALGSHEQAQACWSQALVIFEQLQDADAAQVRALIAEDRTGPAEP